MIKACGIFDVLVTLCESWMEWYVVRGCTKLEKSKLTCTCSREASRDTEPPVTAGLSRKRVGRDTTYIAPFHEAVASVSLNSFPSTILIRWPMETIPGGRYVARLSTNPGPSIEAARLARMNHCRQQRCSLITSEGQGDAHRT